MKCLYCMYYSYSQCDRALVQELYNNVQKAIPNKYKASDTSEEINIYEIWLYEDSDEYKLFAYSRENTYSVVARLCDMERTYVKTASPLFIEKTGLWIDIFPMDTVVEEKVDYEKEIAVIESIHYQIFQCRWQMRKFVLGDLCRIRTFMSWLKHVRRSRKSIRGLVQKHNDLCVAHADSNSSAMSMLAFPTYKEAFPKRVFTNVKDTIFENEEFKIMEGYDEWLRIIYGEYMKLPPVEERKRSHSIHKYFWVDRS